MEGRNENETEVVEGNVAIATARLSKIKEQLTLCNSLKPCKQFQLAIMDCESMAENLASIAEDGYLPRLMEIPLSASEVQDEFEFPDIENPEYVYTEKQPTESGHEVEH